MNIDRKQFVKAMRQVRHLIPRSPTKPVLQAVRLQASAGTLHLSSTNLEFWLQLCMPTSDDLPPCVVPHAELLQRARASSATRCHLTLDKDRSALHLNGGLVDHQLPTIPESEFPPHRSIEDGTDFVVPAGVLRKQFTIACKAVARESHRYAINAALLELDCQGSRLVATDGRRMVVAELGTSPDSPNALTKGSSRQVLLPTTVAKPLGRLVPRSAGHDIRIRTSVTDKKDVKPSPALISFSGPDWQLTATPAEGTFPDYRGVWPKSKCNVYGTELLRFQTLLDEIVAGHPSETVVRMVFEREHLSLSSLDGAGESTGGISVARLEGIEEQIVVGVKADFLRDALAGMSGDEVLLKIRQNKLHRATGKVFSLPLVVSDCRASSVRWLIMPVDLGLESNGVTLGSNFPTEIVEENVAA